MQYDCSAVAVGWTDPSGSISFLAQVVGGGQVDNYATTNTSFELDSLSCGQDYTVTVQAMGAECNSSLSLTESIATGTNQFQHLIVLVEKKKNFYILRNLSREFHMWKIECFSTCNKFVHCVFRTFHLWLIGFHVYLDDFTCLTLWFHMLLSHIITFNHVREQISHVIPRKLHLWNHVAFI